MRLLTKNRLIAVLKAALYIVTHFGRLQQDLARVREAVADWQITRAEADDLQERLTKHLVGLGIE